MLGAAVLSLRADVERWQTFLPAYPDPWLPLSFSVALLGTDPFSGTQALWLLLNITPLFTHLGVHFPFLRFSHCGSRVIKLDSWVF